MLLPEAELKEKGFTRKSMDAVLGVNTKSNLFKHMRKQAEVLEAAAQEGEGQISSSTFAAACSPPNRERRKDALSEYDFKIVQMFWAASTEASPNKKDIIKMNKCSVDGDIIVSAVLE